MYYSFTEKHPNNKLTDLGEIWAQETAPSVNVSLKKHLSCCLESIFNDRTWRRSVHRGPATVHHSGPTAAKYDQCFRNQSRKH